MHWEKTIPDHFPTFASTARGLSRNPLGIVALFLVLVYGIAGLVLGLGASALERDERLPLVWFLVVFPVLVLVVFFRLVTKHHAKLYAPQDFQDKDGFFRALNPLDQAARIQREAEAAVDAELGSWLQEDLVEHTHGPMTNKDKDAMSRLPDFQPFRIAAKPFNIAAKPFNKVLAAKVLGGISPHPSQAERVLRHAIATYVGLLELGSDVVGSSVVGGVQTARGMEYNGLLITQRGQRRTVEVKFISSDASGLAVARIIHRAVKMLAPAYLVLVIEGLDDEKRASYTQFVNRLFYEGRLALYDFDTLKAKYRHALEGSNSAAEVAKKISRLG